MTSMLGFVGVVAIPSPRPHSTAYSLGSGQFLVNYRLSLLDPRRAHARGEARDTAPACQASLARPRSPFKVNGLSPRLQLPGDDLSDMPFGKQADHPAFSQSRTSAARSRRPAA